jgi:zinc-ribbon domain
MDLFVAVFVLIAVAGLTILMFFGWAVAMAVKGISRLVALILGAVFLHQGWRALRCTECGQSHPPSARFCRRCGRLLPGRRCVHRIRGQT